MKVLKEKRDGNTINLEIELTHDEIAAKFDGAFKKVSKNAHIKGFRKGKVPRNVFEQHYGTSNIIQEAIFDAVNDGYKNALSEKDLKVVDYPKDVDIDEYKENKALKFRCAVDVEPDIKLKKYKGLKVAFTEAKADEAALQKELDVLLDMHGIYEAVERESQNNDIIRFNATATINNEPLAVWSRENQATRLGVHNYGEQFDTELTGLKKEDKKSFTVTYPDDFKTADVAGKTVAFDIEVSEIREKKLPEITDALAEKIDKECKTVKELKDKLQKELDSRLENDNKQKKETLILDTLLEENPLEIPKAMIEQEIKMSLYQFEYTLQQQGMDLKKYMQITNKTEDDLKNDMADSSEKRIKLRKLIEAIIAKEKIEVSDDDIQTEVSNWNHETIKTVDDLKNSKSHDINHLSANLLDQKVREFLVTSAKIK
jgi:trigger factor